MTETYAGKELPLFREANNFHDYYFRLFGPWIRGDVLEVGGGIGALTTLLLRNGAEHLTVCEPDPALASELQERFGDRAVVIRSGIHGVPRSIGSFDTIAYIDVLEHIQDDVGEVAAAAARLKPGGSLVVAGPAHTFLYSAFDAAIGHYRRYDRVSIESLLRKSGSLEMVRFAYFDCLGVVLSLGNRWVNRQSLPSRRQLLFWDRVVLPLSRRLDSLLNYRVGKSFVAVATRGNERDDEARKRR
jgi:SAM-dependent methyltransferase